MYIVAASFIGLQAFIPYLYIWGPADIEGLRAGFENDAMYIRAIEPNSHLAQAGLRAGDRVIAIDRLPVSYAREWDAVLANMYPGKPQQWEIVRDQRTLELQIVPERVNWRRQFYIGYVITALGCLVLGLLIGFQRPADPVARFGAWFTALLRFFEVSARQSKQRTTGG